MPVVGWAQAGADLVGWTWAGVRVQPDSGHWAVEANYQYITYQHLARAFVRSGLGRLSYTWPRQHVTLALTYVAGSVDERGRVQLTQLQLGRVHPAGQLQPRWQFTLDCLQLLPETYQGQARPPVYRVRPLVGIEPPLSSRLHLVLNTEPFLYRTGSWLREVRSQAGVQWQPVPQLAVQALYWNWWADYRPRRVSWQHTLLLAATVSLGRRRAHHHAGQLAP